MQGGFFQIGILSAQLSISVGYAASVQKGAIYLACASANKPDHIST